MDRGSRLVDIDTVYIYSKC